MTSTARAITDLTKQDLGHVVAVELGVTHAEGRAAVEAVLNAITRTVASGHQVAVSNFATFRPVWQPARDGWNFQTGQPMTVPGRHRLQIIVSPQFQDAVKAQDPAAALITKRPRPTN
ncbi:HU family DNA-binding protein [Streptomyces sp. NPDC052114]|uniref:HU family DNA-binding protein n=1 Tax=unclassified Streptomyces TaxID=2593676 RepID=UPI00342FFEA2